MASGYRSVPDSASRLFLMVVYRSEWGDNRARDMLLDRGRTVEVCCPARGDALPGSPGGYAGVIVGGGLDGLLDDGRPPYVVALVELTRACLEQDVAFLGFCFGAQVLAAAGEGRVLMRPDGRGAYGYRPVRPVNAEGEKVLSGLRTAYHLHFHGFEAPPGSVSLAAGELFPSSVFRLGANAYGFQFHPEIRADQIETVLSHLGLQALARPGVDPVPRHLRDAGSHAGEVHAWLERFMDGWIDPEAGPMQLRSRLAYRAAETA